MTSLSLRLFQLFNSASISIDGAYNINCYGGTGSVDITVTGGITGTYSYNWSTADGSGIIDGQADQPALTAGTYHLKITDQNSCEKSIDITLTQPPSITLNFSVTDITCQSSAFNDGSIDLTVSGGIAPYTYLWSNGLITEDITGLTDGYYKVIVTDLNGCHMIDSIRVDLPPPLIYTKTISDFNGYQISCKGLATGYILIGLTSGEPPYSYLWTGPGGYSAASKDITGLIAGDYTLTITDNNFCSATETINVK